MNNCFSIYHTSWITSGPKSNLFFEYIATKAILFFSGCSEVNSTWRARSMHDVECEFARAAVRSKDAQKQLARTSLSGLHTANLSWQTRVGKSKLVCVNCTKTGGKHVCKLLASNRNVFADCFYAVHTPSWVCQHESANFSLPCEGRLRYARALLCVAKVVTLHVQYT